MPKKITKWGNFRSAPSPPTPHLLPDWSNHSSPQFELFYFSTRGPQKREDKETPSQGTPFYPSSTVGNNLDFDLNLFTWPKGLGRCSSAGSLWLHLVSGASLSFPQRFPPMRIKHSEPQEVSLSPGSHSPLFVF